MIKVKDERGLARDPSSKAILTVDPEILMEHRRKKKLARQLHTAASRVEHLEQQTVAMAAQINHLTTLVTALLNQNK